MLLFYGNKNKFFKFFISLFTTLVVLFSLSRSGIFVLTIHYLYLYIISIKNNKKNIIYSIIFIILLLALNNIIPFEQIYSNFVRAFSDSYVTRRFLAINDSISSFLSNPIFGEGYGLLKYSGEAGVVSHNLFLELLSGMGIVGFFLNMVLFYFIYNNSEKKYKITLIFYFIFSLFLDTYTFPLTWVLFSMSFYSKKNRTIK